MPIKCPQRPNRAHERARHAEEQWQRDRVREGAEQFRREQERLRRERERAQERAREQARERARQQTNYYTTRIADADQALALELVNAGYRALSRKHHPDAGGSHEQMVAVNKITDILRTMISGRK